MMKVMESQRVQFSIYIIIFFLFLHYSLNVDGKMLNVNSVIEFSNNVYLTSYKLTFVRVDVFRLIVD